MNRTDILNALAYETEAERYLEIGIRNPSDNFDRIQCARRTGVDRRMIWLPAEGRDWELFRMTSDVFFARYPDRQFDLVLVDGHHMAEFVRRDVRNALRTIDGNTDGCVVMHDCNPPDERHTHGSLCGTAYQVFLECRTNYGLQCYCVDCDYGVGVIRHRTGHDCPTIELPAEYDYATFANRRAEWLNLIAPDDWKPA